MLPLSSHSSATCYSSDWEEKKVLFCSVFSLGPSSGLLFFFITQPSSNTLFPRLGVSLLLWKEV